MEEQNNKSNAAYKTAIRRIISQNNAKHLAASAIFAAKRKIFTSRRLGRVAIAGISPEAYMDAQVTYNNLLQTVDLEIFEAKHGIFHAIFLAIKRTADILFGLIGCIFLIPLTIFVKLGNMLTGDFAPVFYHTKRIGKNGKEFDFYKFRSMVRTKDGRNAEYLLDELFEKRPDLKEQWEKTRKLDDDPRITKMGKFIRKTSIDEIPQFFNILKGDMSLIGPRPLMVGELDEHYGSHETYESVKPGLTGWWAANGRSGVEDYNERLQLEYYYAHNQSLWLDIKTIILTAKTVLVGKGAQ